MASSSAIFPQISSQFQRYPKSFSAKRLSSSWLSGSDPTSFDYFGVWKWALKFSKVFSFKWTITRVSSGFLGASYWLRRHPWRRRFWGVGDTRWSVAAWRYICQIHLLNHRWRVWWSASFKSINPDSVVKKMKGQSQSLDLLGPQGKSWHPFIIRPPKAYKGDF